MFVKPAPGLTFRDPATKLRVPPEGIEVPNGDLTWARLIRDGDAVEIPAIEAAAEAPAPDADAPAPDASGARKKGAADAVAAQ